MVSPEVEKGVKAVKPGIKMVAILGPTATGKSSLGVELAQRYFGEIIACDSRQVYRGLEVGTGKATLAERELVPHFLIDVVDPDGHFSAADYQEQARRSAGEIQKRGNRVFLVGGTGFYFRAFLGLLFPGGEADPVVRDRIEETRNARGEEYLFRWLREVDPESARGIHPHDVYRVRRALEIFLTTGIPAAEMRKRNKFPDPEYQVLKIGLTRSRDELRDRISRRVEWMYDTGVDGSTLLDEVEGFLEKGYHSDARAFQSIGYREAIACCRGRMSPREAKDRTRQLTWEYSRRQQTWFRREEGIKWFHPRQGRNAVIEEVGRFWEH